MEAGMIIGLAITIPVILFPAAFVWYLNIGGVAAAVREAKAKRTAQEKAVAAK